MITHNAAQCRRSASFFALATAIMLTPCQAAFAQEAPAEQADEQGGDSEDIIVTGTILRGVAPVGSSIISLNAADIQKTGLLTTTDILRSIPQVTGIGAGEAATGTSANNANLNISRTNGLNIRGLGVQATLTLLNGRRLPVGGFGAQLFDPNSVPAIAMARIDVVADGASATYGSDAVAGVANLILRTDVEGVEARARYGFADDYSTKTISAVAGHQWETGRVMIAAEWSKNSELLQSDRARFFSCNQLASGGTNNCSFGGSPGNIVYGTTRYGLPGGSGVGVTEAQLLATPNRLESYVYTTAIPANERLNFVGSIRQDLTDNLTVWAEGFYYNRNGKFYVGSPASGSNGAIPATVAVTSTNPNFVRIAGRSLTSQNVEYSIFNDIGEGRPANSLEHGSQMAAGMDFKLNDNWQFSSWYAHNDAFSEVFRYNEINNVQLGVALACNPGGPCLNPYGSGGSASNLAALQNVLGFTRFRAWYNSDVVNAQIGGTLMTIPGGDIKIAVGGQYLHEKFAAHNTSNSGAGPTSLNDVRVTAEFGRAHSIKSAFAELIVPLVGDGNAMPGLQKLELNIAGRFDDYSDVGTTTNPKFGIKWQPVNGLTVRGSYGKSFRAPTLTEVDPRSTPSLAASTTTAGAGRNVLTLLGGNDGVKPEKATTWSFGVEYRPDALPGLFLSLNYFDIDYQNVIDTPGNNAAVFSDPTLAPFVIFNPTATQYNDIVQSRINSGLYRPVTAFVPVINTVTNTTNVYAIADGRKNNTGRIQMNGLDFQINYAFGTGIGDWNLGLSGTRVFHYNFQAVPGAVTTDRVNNVNFPLKFRARGQIGWRSGGLSVNTFYNYTNAYRAVGLVSNNQFTPAIVSPAIQSERIGANLTVDATISYAFPAESGVFNDLIFSVSAQNLFDRDPPFARVTNSQIFDSANASVLGRFIAFEVRKKF